jgi:CBS domain-containing protein
MNAAQIMVRDVITVPPTATVQEIASTLVRNHISAVPVVDAHGGVLGIVSEGDLMRRAEIGTERLRSWWLHLFTPAETLSHEFVKAHGRKASDVMTSPAVTAAPDASLADIAGVLERHRIKRVPIVKDGRLVGIVSRANLVQALAAAPPGGMRAPRQESDEAIRNRVLDYIRAQPWGMPWLVNVSVENGVVQLWGAVGSEAERQAVRVAAEAAPGVTDVQDNLFVRRTDTGT